MHSHFLMHGLPLLLLSITAEVMPPREFGVKILSRDFPSGHEGAINIKNGILPTIFCTLNAKINTLFLKWNHVIKVDNDGSDLLYSWVRFLKSMCFPTLHLCTWKQFKPSTPNRARYSKKFSKLVLIHVFQYQ